MICILSSTHAATGGTELLQQLCYQLRQNKIDAAMFYTEPYEDSNVKKKFEIIYNNPVVKEVPEGAIAVCPETDIDILNNIWKRFSKIYIWWLSVDNYYGSNRIKVGFIRSVYRRLKHHRNKKLFKSVSHLVQSQYAMDYLNNELKISGSVEKLSDYLNLDYLNNIDGNLNLKKNWILYNPKKGYEFTQKLIKAVPEYEWVALEGLSNIEMKNTLAKAKVYVDFGNHPGKDRIPREAAINYCCVITGKRGAAKNTIDIPIGDKYKFEDREESIPFIHETIKYCMNEFDSALEDFETYREMIQAEPNKFSEDMLKIFVDDKDLD